jgi:sulfoxide reductase catalytic subunit YedY
MIIKRIPDIPSSEITPERLYLRRREFVKIAVAGAAVAAGGLFAGGAASQPLTPDALPKLQGFGKSALSSSEKPNAWKDLTTYNNYYEFGTDKHSPAEHASRLKTRPWTVSVEGEVRRPKTFDFDDLLKLGQEERIYRLRCVEAWSIVIPWVGFSFDQIAKIVEPTGNAKFVEFVTAYQPENMPGVRLPVLDWPYVEGLRIDEAMHPLTLMAIGLYDRLLPNQSGAPVRLVVPWKYGFKSGKSITRIRFVSQQPRTAWEKAAPHEYGFYSNVNPDVDHPRWSQASERRLGEFGKRKTVAFNGYGAQVASLYAGMDLKKHF